MSAEISTGPVRFESPGWDGSRAGPGLFFTGTDTGVGKTYVTAAVAQVLRGRGRAVAVCKPVATGGTPGPGGLHSDDTRALAAAAGVELSLDRVTPWCFPEPVAPPVAARLHGVTLSIVELTMAVRRWRAPDRIVLVEGVGGLLCPLTEKETVADLAAEIGYPLIIVARRSLGTLNHTLLTLRAARARGLRVAGVVVNETARPEDLAAMSNVEELRRWIDVPLLTVVPYEALATEGLGAVDWWALAV